MLYQAPPAATKRDLRKDGRECDTPFDASHFGATTRVPITHCFSGLSIADQVKLLQRRAAGGAQADQASAAHQLLIWDKVLGLGRTDPLAGFAAITSNLAVSFSSPNKVLKT